MQEMIKKIGIGLIALVVGGCCIAPVLLAIK